MSRDDKSETFYLWTGFFLIVAATFFYFYAAQAIWIGHNQVRSYYWIFTHSPYYTPEQDIWEWIHDSYWSLALALTGAGIIFITNISKREIDRTVGLFAGLFFILIPAFVMESLGDIFFYQQYSFTGDRNWLTELMFGLQTRPGEPARPEGFFLEIGPFRFITWIFIQWCWFFTALIIVSCLLINKKSRTFLVKNRIYIAMEIIIAGIVLFFKYFTHMTYAATSILLIFLSISFFFGLLLYKYGLPGLREPIFRAKISGGEVVNHTLRTPDGLLALMSIVAAGIGVVVALLGAPIWTVLLGGIIPVLTTSRLLRDNPYLNLKVFLGLLGAVIIMELTMVGMVGNINTIFFSTAGDPDPVAHLQEEWGFEVSDESAEAAADMANPLNAITSVFNTFGQLGTAVATFDIVLIAQLLVGLALAIGPVVLAVGVFMIATQVGANKGIMMVFAGGVGTVISIAMTAWFPSLMTLRVETLESSAIFNTFSTVGSDPVRYTFGICYSVWLLMPIFGLAITVIGAYWSYHHPRAAKELTFLSTHIKPPYRVGGSTSESPVLYSFVSLVSFVALVVALVAYEATNVLMWLIPLLLLSMLFMFRRWQKGRQWDFCSFNIDKLAVFGGIIGFVVLEICTVTLQFLFSYYNLISYAVIFSISPIWTDLAVTAFIIPILETLAFSSIFMEVTWYLLKRERKEAIEKAEKTIERELKAFQTESTASRSRIEELRERNPTSDFGTLAKLRDAVTAADLTDRLQEKQRALTVRHAEMRKESEEVDHNTVRQCMLLATAPTALVFGIFHLFSRVAGDWSLVWVFLTIYLPLYFVGGLIMWGSAGLSKRLWACWITHFIANTLSVVLLI